MRIFTLIFLLFAGMLPVRAQHCGFDQLHQRQLLTDPAYAQRVNDMNTQLTAMLQTNPLGLIINTPGGLIYEIPVVVHIIHTGGAVGTVYNPDDTQIEDMIDYLNKTYEATWPGYPSATTGGTYIPLRFKLAKRTPSCMPTNGIIRVDGSIVPGYVSGGVSRNFPLLPGIDDPVLKNISRWPNNRYYNIWVVNKISGQDGLTPGSPYVAGYAYFPGASANVDGTVILASQAMAGKSTLPHEIGHAFSLYHTFEGDNGGGTCPTDNNCTTDGDRVCDTDPHMRSPFNCPSATTNPCTGVPHGTVVHNMMDYSSCSDRFTPGQSTRVINALLTQRAGLITSLGTIPPAGSGVIAACIPTVNTATIAGSGSGPREITISEAAQLHMSVTSSGYAGDGSQHYIDNTCVHQVTLTAGVTYDFTVSTGFSPEKVRVYIDYNNDGTFQPNEEIYTHDGTMNFEDHTFQYTVPDATTVPGLLSCVPLRMRVVSDRASIASVTACGELSYGQAEDYSVMILSGGPSGGTVSVNLTTGTNPSCFNSQLTFTAVPGIGITNPSYLWLINNITTGVTTGTYSSSGVNNGDIVSVRMIYLTACGGTDTAFSPDYMVIRQATAPPTVAIALTSGTNPGCPGQSLSFTATPQNGGTAPAYQWKVNGVNQGTNDPVFTFSTLNNNDMVSVEMTSNSSCAVPPTVSSDTITVIHATILQSDVFISMTSGNIPACQGETLSFLATPFNGGQTPQYQWLVNQVAIPGATNDAFTSSTLTTGDEVSVVLFSSDPCVTNTQDTSNAFLVAIVPTLTPIALADITAGNNPGCLDSLIEFTATAANHGSNPDYTWLLNNTPVGTGLTFSTNTLLNGDVVVFRSVATDGACYTSDTIFSNPISLSLFTTPQPVIISLIGTMIFATSSTGDIQWYGPDGLIPGVNGSSYHPTQPGTYYVRINNNGCLSPASNMLSLSLLDVGEQQLASVDIFPNPTSERVTFDWGRLVSNVSFEVFAPTGQLLLQESMQNQTHKTLDLSGLATGLYFVVVREDGILKGTVRIALTP